MNGLRQEWEKGNPSLTRKKKPKKLALSFTHRAPKSGALFLDAFEGQTFNPLLGTVQYLRYIDRCL